MSLLINDTVLFTWEQNCSDLPRSVPETGKSHKKLIQKWNCSRKDPFCYHMNITLPSHGPLLLTNLVSIGKVCAHVEDSKKWRKAIVLVVL